MREKCAPMLTRSRRSPVRCRESNKNATLAFRHMLQLAADVLRYICRDREWGEELRRGETGGEGKEWKEREEFAHGESGKWLPSLFLLERL